MARRRDRRMNSGLERHEVDLRRLTPRWNHDVVPKPGVKPPQGGFVPLLPRIYESCRKNRPTLPVNNVCRGEVYLAPTCPHICTTFIDRRGGVKERPWKVRD